MNSRCLTEQEIKAQALRLGFVACGVAKAEPVEPLYAQHYLRRIQQGHFAGMEYMTRHVDMRLNPHLLHPGLQTIVSVALNYMPASRQPAVCLYAQGQDYHEVMRERLHLLMESLGAHGRCFVDTAPVMERYWAWRSGVGHFCRNGLISVSGYGPTVFLGELFLEESADHYGEPLPSSHSLQQGWQELCPALTPDGLDARLCLNYWTIEHRGELPPSIRLTDCLYGCDRCMRACEEFLEVRPTSLSSFQPSPALMAMTEQDWRTLTPEQFRCLFRHSAIKRAKYEGLMRNISHWYPRQNGTSDVSADEQG